ncbi:MAG TPA: CHAD domain-containing protein [Polyangiaceae bacterium]|nr:CHAD domain-containing protein [Polyangiaceae bacterium]
MSSGRESSSRGAAAPHGRPPLRLARTAPMAGPFLATQLRAFNTRLDELGRRALASEDDDAVHDLRVALRRTRTLLEVGRDIFGRFRVDEVRRALGDVQRATSGLRDEEILLELVASLVMQRPDVRDWVEARKRRERRLRTALRHVLRTGQLQIARRLLDALLAFRVKPSRDRRLDKFARRALLQAEREVARRRRSSSGDAQTLHRLRIAYKHLRYRAATFADILPPDVVAPIVHSSARFQSLLGDVHDVDVVKASVERARTLSAGGRAALLSALNRVRAVRIEAFNDVTPAASPRRGQNKKELSTSRVRLASAIHSSGTASLRKTSTR